MAGRQREMKMFILLGLILVAILFPGFLRWLLSLIALLFVGVTLAGMAHAQSPIPEWTNRSEQLNEERLGNRQAAQYFKQKADQEDALKRQDPDGFSASEKLKTEYAPSADNVYLECLSGTQECYAILRNAYAHLLSLPHGINHPEMSFCEKDISISDENIRRYFMQIARKRGRNPENVNLFLGYVLTFMIPCPIKPIPAHQLN